MDSALAFTVAYVVVGALLILMSLSQSYIARLPLSSAMLYLLVGLAMGPLGLDLLRLDAMEDSVLLERLTELAVIVSLFISGMKLDLPWTDRRWRIPLLLASVSMLVTVAVVAAVSVMLLDLPWGLAILLGAMLAPTDPVLASDVQLSNAGDRDRLRFALTGEGGLNDGTAFPFVMLGLGLVGLHDLGEWAWRWWAVDVLWAVSAGLAIGGALGALIGKLVIHLRRVHREAWISDEFISLGLIALAYGLALLWHAYGFLAVFAAGLALGRLDRLDREKHAEGFQSEPTAQSASFINASPAGPGAPSPTEPPPSTMAAVKRFNLQLERMVEVGVVLAVGVMMASVQWQADVLWFIPMLFLGIRPLSVWLGLRLAQRGALERQQQAMMSWFGIRGIGSMYYLMYAISHGLSAQEAAPLVSITVSVIVASVILHGVSVTPLMKHYEARKLRKKSQRPSPPKAQSKTPN